MLWHIILFKINKIHIKSQTSARDEEIVDQGQFVLRSRDASIFTGTKVTVQRNKEDFYSSAFSPPTAPKGSQSSQY